MIQYLMITFPVKQHAHICRKQCSSMGYDTIWTSTGYEHLITHNHTVDEIPLAVKFVMSRLDGTMTRSSLLQLVCGLEYENCTYDVGRYGVSVNRYNKLGRRS